MVIHLNVLVIIINSIVLNLNSAKSIGMKLTFISPRYSQSIGLSERSGGLCKEMLKKSRETGRDIHEYLLEYRATPLWTLSISPSELLFNRLIRSSVPTFKAKMK